MSSAGRSRRRLKVNRLALRERMHALLQSLVLLQVESPATVCERLARVVSQPAEFSCAALDAPALELVVLAPDREVAPSSADDLVQLASGCATKASRDGVVDEMKLSLDEQNRPPLVVILGALRLYDSCDLQPILGVTHDVHSYATAVEPKATALVRLRCGSPIAGP